MPDGLLGGCKEEFIECTSQVNMLVDQKDRYSMPIRHILFSTCIYEILKSGHIVLKIKSDCKRM
jgi:hypothetical protein